MLCFSNNKIEGLIKNGQSRDTDNIEHKRLKTTTQHRKLKKIKKKRGATRANKKTGDELRARFS
jgi:regulator of RNase E activity RraA